MQKTFPAVYENGIRRPLVPLDLLDSQQVEVSLVDPNDDIALYFEKDEWEAAKRDEVSLEVVRRALSCIKGNLSDGVIGLREQRY